MSEVFKGESFSEKRAYFEKVKKIRDELHHAGASFLLGLDKRRFKYTKDKEIISTIENHLIRSEKLLHRLLKRMLKDLVGNPEGYKKINPK